MLIPADKVLANMRKNKINKLKTMIRGMAGEQIARCILLDRVGISSISQYDWIVRDRNGATIAIEVKYKELFVNIPGTQGEHGLGADIVQIKSKMDFYDRTKIRTLFIFIDPKSDDVYWAYLDELERTDYYDTKNKIRIYKLKYFHKMDSEAKEIVKKWKKENKFNFYKCLHWIFG